MMFFLHSPDDGIPVVTPIIDETIIGNNIGTNYTVNTNPYPLNDQQADAVLAGELVMYCYSKCIYKDIFTKISRTSEVLYRINIHEATIDGSEHGLNVQAVPVGSQQKMT